METATPALVQSSSFKIRVVDGLEEAPEIEAEFLMKEYEEDITPPEITMTLVASLEEGTDIVAFNAIDKESGIKSIQIRFKKWFSYSQWENASNPYDSSRWSMGV